MLNSIVKLLQATPITIQTRRFLQNSQCIPPTLDVQPWVCCGSTATATPTATVKPETSTGGKTLPKAPKCGIDTPDRIFGGVATKVDEVKYEKCLQLKN